MQHQSLMNGEFINNSILYLLKTSSLVYEVQHQYTQMNTKTCKDHKYSSSNKDKTNLLVQFSRLDRFVLGREDFEN